MSRASFGIAGLLILCVFFEGCGYTASPQINAVKNAANHSARYLTKNIKKNGMFEYRINMDPAIKVKKRYNILRHAGTIYSMSMYYRLQPDINMYSAIKRAGTYLKDKSIGPIPGKNGMLAVWSKPEVNQSNKPFQAKLGGTGLGLVALLSIEKIHPGFTPLSDLQSLGQFIVYMQKKDGSFYSRYIPSMEGRLDNWQSLYYPGEAALGLIMLYERDGSSIWIESAAKALQYLARSRKNSTNIPSDHWALLATEKILSLKNSNELPVSRKLLISHAIQICEAILKTQIKNTLQSKYNGGFAKDGRTTPTSTRLEGLQAVLSFIPPEHEMHKRIDLAVSAGISFLLRAQIKEGKFMGAFPRAVAKINQNAPSADKFNRRATEVRIDYVQHALSGLIQYVNRIDNKKK